MKWLNLVTGGYGSLVLYGLLAASIAGAFGWTYHKGYDSAATAWSLKYDQREAAITKAYNDRVSHDAQANAMAKAIEAKRLAELAAENAALEAHVKELSDEANADPDANRPALSDDSGMRIDSVH